MADTDLVAPAADLQQIGRHVRSVVERADCRYDNVRSCFDPLTPVQKRAAILALGGRKCQARLWKLANEGPRFGIEQLIPSNKPALQPVIFYGKNSLPGPVSVFQKRMCWAPSGEQLFGYNHQWYTFAIGPGYFVVCASDKDHGPVVVDYTRLPDTKPAAWPKIRSNGWLLSRFIFYGMKDYLRFLSEGVLIGRAERKGKIMENYFLLSRED